jgi:hypothetical protein
MTGKASLAMPINTSNLTNTVREITLWAISTYRWLAGQEQKLESINTTLASISTTISWDLALRIPVTSRTPCKTLMILPPRSNALVLMEYCRRTGTFMMSSLTTEARTTPLIAPLMVASVTCLTTSQCRSMNSPAEVSTKLKYMTHLIGSTTIR